MPQKTIMSFLGRYLLCGAQKCRYLQVCAGNSAFFIIIKTKYG